MADEPRVYLTNAASRRPPYRGPGRVLTVMAHPRAEYGEAGVGVVPFLVPPWDWVSDAKAGRISVDEYRGRYNRLVERRGGLAPGRLNAVLYEGEVVSPVAEGDTLVCACGREAAREGRCHRVWAAGALIGAGWRVILDGMELG